MRHLAQIIYLPGNGDQSVQVEGFKNFRFNTVGDVITTAIPYIFAFAGFGLLLMLISSGFSFLTSAGDTKKMETAKSRLTNALVGFVIVFVSYWLVQIGGKVFGIPEIGSIFK